MKWFNLLLFLLCCNSIVVAQSISVSGMGRNEASRVNDFKIAVKNDSIAECYTKINQLDSAIIYKKLATDKYSKIYEESDTLYTNCLYELGCLYFDAQQYEEAICCFEKIENLQEKYNLYDPSGHSLVLAHLSLSYAYIEAYQQAIRVCKVLLELKEKNITTVDFSYIEILGYLTNYYLADNKVYEALENALSAFSYMEKDSTTDVIDRITTIEDIAQCYNELRDPESAIKHLEKAIIYSEELINTDEKHGCEAYCTLLWDLANIFASQSNYQEAVRVMGKCISFCKDKYGTNDIHYAQSLLILARYNSDTGYYSYAEELCKDACDIHKRLYGESNQYTLLAQLSHARYMAVVGRYNEAISLGTEVANKYKKVYDERSHHYAKVLSQLSEIYAIAGNANMASEMMLESISICESHSLMNSDMQFELAQYYALGNKYQKAVEMCTSALENERIGNIEKYLFHAYLAEYCYYLNDVDKAKYHLKKYYSEMLSSFSNIFIELPYASKKDYWDYYGEKMRKILPLIAVNSQDQSIINLAYDFSALLSKGLLFRADNIFRESIYDTKDSELIDKYLELNSNKNELFNLLRSSSNKEKCDSLSNLIQEREFELLKTIKVDKQRELKWTDIRNSLNQGDIAVEFISFPCDEGERYLALTLKKDFVGPKCYNLFIDDGNGNLDRINHIWEIIKEDLSGVNCIYFSPTGIINDVAIEYSPFDTIANISERYNVYRVSSTSKIGEVYVQNRNTAALFGNLQYDLAPTIQRKHSDSNSYPYRRISRGLNDSLKIRGGFDPLYFTKDEIDEISQVMKKNNMHICAYTGENGTEESFRDLSGRNLNVLHIATHGMYIGTGNESIKKGNHFPIIQNSDGQYNSFTEDQQLTRSFLVMSGGNMLSRRVSMPDYMDDGILTAQEISLLDFRNLDIVSLSACQTALGVLTSEGVIGLQRGFKKAGANTLLMSLGKVDDEATKILMVEFYKNLMAGKSKYQSLKDAQKYLRQVENGKYDKPEYWASFILLDGLN